MKPAFLPTILLAVCLFIVSVFSSCGSDEQPVSKAEALQLAKSIQSTIENHNPKLINSILDIRAFSANIEKNTKLDVDRTVRNAIKESLEKRMLGNEIVQAVGKDGQYRLLRQYEKDGKQHLLFRLYGESGINYHDFELVKRRNEVKAADLFLYYTGEPFSATLGNMVAEMMGKFKDDADESIVKMRKIQKMISGKNKDAAGAKALFDQLPEKVKQQKLFMMTYVSICSDLDQDQYMAALEQYQKIYPNETNIPLLLIDLTIMRKDYEGALKAVNDLDRLVGTDPFLNYFRGLVYKMKEDKENYRLCIERLYAYDPEFESGVIELIALYLDEKDFDKARPLITKFHEHKKWKQNILNLVIQQREGVPKDLQPTDFGT